MTKIKQFFRRETVLCCAALLAVVSMVATPPGAAYLTYINWPTLTLLFCLMLVVAGWRDLGLFESLGEALTRRVRTQRGLRLVLVALCFFTSMLITNDVALITFVPFTLLLLKQEQRPGALLSLVVLETIAANLGSMLTPIGNPQNLFLFSLGGWSVADFLWQMLPLTLASGLALALCVELGPKGALLKAAPAPAAHPLRQVTRQGRFWLFLLLFLVCLAQVLHLVSYLAVFALVLVAALIWDRKRILQVDYSLLLTFVCFFIFVGNIQHLPAVQNWLTRLIVGHELWTGLLVSQAVSNVPAAILLSGFTHAYGDLLWGVNIGGLGTLIASMASLISYKYYVGVPGAKGGRYLLVFTGYNLLFLALLCGLAVLLRSW